MHVHTHQMEDQYLLSHCMFEARLLNGTAQRGLCSDGFGAKGNERVLLGASRAQVVCLRVSVFRLHVPCTYREGYERTAAFNLSRYLPQCNQVKSCVKCQAARYGAKGSMRVLSPQWLNARGSMHALPLHSTQAYTDLT